MLLKTSALLALLLTLTASQDTGVLRIRVALPDGAGGLIPMPRVLLLVSDNPATIEPRRVRTLADGTIELKLKPGSYTVESDQPVSLAGRLFAWTQMIDVVAGRETTLNLGGDNANTDVDATGTAPTSGDAAKVFSIWRDSVVEVWTPTTHASGFVIDSKGLIATSHHALNGETSVEVQLTKGSERLKVPGTVVLSERLTGAAIIWVDPSAISRPIAPACAPRERVPAFKDPIIAIASPMLAPKSLTDGSVTRVTEQAIFADMRLARDSAGAPVFDDQGELVGLGAFEVNREDPKRWTDAWVVPINKVCATLEAAAAKMTGGTPPRPASLPMEPVQGSTRVQVLKPNAAAIQKRLPITLTAADFDLTLLTPWHVQTGTIGSNAKTDFANWSDYVADAPPLLMIRVTPKFEESIWKTIARGAAATQGVALPPLPSFRSNFIRMRTFCGDTEVQPIHPSIIERRFAEQKIVREGLYVFGTTELGPHCQSARLEIYSEKNPKRPDIKTIDPKLFEQVVQSQIQ
ncbi:MAG TPA: serine protease [Vicinamibacterales bacterium]|nr:serine protease [Vicinamibacterales bacterium]